MTPCTYTYLYMRWGRTHRGAMEEPRPHEGSKGGDGVGSATANPGYTCQRGEVRKRSVGMSPYTWHAWTYDLEKRRKSRTSGHAAQGMSRCACTGYVMHGSHIACTGYVTLRGARVTAGVNTWYGLGCTYWYIITTYRHILIFAYSHHDVVVLDSI